MATDQKFTAGQFFSTGLCYLMCKEIPGDAQIGDSVQEGHEAYWFFESLEKPTIPGYSGNTLNTSSRILLSPVEIILNSTYATAFSTKCFDGSIFEKVTIVALKNYGESNMGKTFFTLEMLKAKITSYQDNITPTYTGETVISLMPADNLQKKTQALKDPILGDTISSAVKLTFAAVQYNWIYSKIDITGVNTGQLATGFNCQTNSMIK